MKLRQLLQFLRLGRLEFVGFLFGVMLSGALALQSGHVSCPDLLVLLAVAVLTNLWGFAHNDICDAEIDRQSADLSDRPLVSGTVSITSAWRLTILCIVATLPIVALNRNGMRALPILMASGLLGLLYNNLSKKLPGSDLLFAASTALLCVLGAVLVSDRAVAHDPAWKLVWTVGIIQFLDHVLFNAGATLKDVKNDRAMAAVTMATFCGVTVGENDALFISRRFRGTIILLKLSSLFLLFASPFWSGVGFSSVQCVLLAIAAIASLSLTAHAVNIKVFDRRDIGRRWVRQEAMGKLLVPLLLVQVAGWPWAVFLAAGPLAWFLLSNAVLHKRGASLHVGF